jgi:hypothetical protein
LRSSGRIHGERSQITRTNRVPVWRSLGDDGGANDTTRTNFIFDYDRLTKSVGQFARKQPHPSVYKTASGVRCNQGNAFIWPRLSVV